jgi:MoaA/NifB/PqqE/SkfB family radical SAM enzyme
MTNMQNNLELLIMKPTDSCYHRCCYCKGRQEYYSELNNCDTQKDLQPHDAIRFIDEAAMLGMKSLQISGGDPLRYPYLVDIIKSASKYKDIFVFINSVGSGIHFSSARNIIESGLCAWNFSIDTLNGDTYSELRGVKDALSEVLNSVEVVRAAASDFPDFCINYMTVITRKNFRDLPNLLRHCINTNVSSMYLMNLYGDTSGTLYLNCDELKEFREFIVPEMINIISNSNCDDIVLENAKDVLYSFYSTALNSDENYSIGKYWRSSEDAKKACVAPNKSMFISSHGRVLPCCMVEISHTEDLGSALNTPLSNIWFSEGYEMFRKQRLDFCQYCPAPQNRTLGLVPKMCRQF